MYKVNRGNFVVFFLIEIIFYILLIILTFIICYTSTLISTYVKFHALSTEYKVETQTNQDLLTRCKANNGC